MNARHSIRNILHPTDLGESGHSALSLATTLARQLWATLHVLHVEAPAKRGEAAAELKRIAAAHRELPLVAVTRSGPLPSASILEYADENGSDLIVMAATRLHRGFGHLLGSVAREVIEGSDLPVLTVRGGEDHARQLKRVLVPVDFSSATHEAVDVAAEIVRGVGGEVILLHVLPEPHHAPLPARWAHWHSRQKAQAEAELRSLEATLDSGVRTSTRIRAGSPVDEIVRCAAELDVDLVVIASHASTGHRAVGGSVAEEVQRFATTPVLLMKTAHRYEQRAAG
ncbi:MAG TPA: universal stress protein [Thermoanaerobaculia bacterium]|jgi:nucleotide-binding universal stress UspA family protein|nr:universal stress protein [Thermoanaerobaculia bacterium]